MPISPYARARMYDVTHILNAASNKPNNALLARYAEFCLVKYLSGRWKPLAALDQQLGDAPCQTPLF
jgi:hypothetical protein